MIKFMKKRYFIFSLILLFLVSIVIYSANPIHESIARIKIEGPLKSNLALTDKLSEIEKNPKIKALIVYINSPGGSAVAGEEIYVSLRKISKIKPVVSIMGDIATSAGYLTAIGTDYIIARENTLTGNVGVVIQHLDFEGILQKLGVKVSSIASGALKTIGSPYDSLDPAEREVLQNNINKSFRSFITLVQTRRNITEEHIKLISDGRPFLGSEALKLNLIDQIGGMDEALEWIRLSLKRDIRYTIVDIELDSNNYLNLIKKLF